jgi:hypothetical protein
VSWAKRRDANEPAIVDTLEHVGALVLRLDRFDLLVYYRGRLFMMDAKTPKGTATTAQQQLQRAGWPLVYVHDPIAALRVIGAEAAQ